LETLSAKELSDWADFYAREPWGSEAAFLRSGIIAATIANVNRNSKTHPEPFSPMDFMPDFTGRRKKARQKAFRHNLKAHFGRRIKTRAGKVLDQRSEGVDTPDEDPGTGS
jgi:hypothetical protein